MRRCIFIVVFALSGCGGMAWNTTVADHPQVRDAMLASIVPGLTTEKRFTAQWGMPTQKIREGAQTSLVYRNMKNPPLYFVPQFGNSQAFVVAVFQYGLAVGGYSSDTHGCRATFAPRPPGPNLDNPTTVHTVNCGVTYDGSSEFNPIGAGVTWLQTQIEGVYNPAESTKPIKPGVQPDTYSGGKYK